MKKPKKKSTDIMMGNVYANYTNLENQGYNLACDDHKPYIKSLKDKIKELEDRVEELQYENMGEDI